MTLELQQYLREKGLENLASEYAIKVNRHHKYPHLVCLKYSQIESPMSEKIVQQSRGIILDEINNWQIISYSYSKFFNYGEPLADHINWHKATVYDKLDGSLMVLYYYDQEWRVQSSGTADGSGQVYGFSFSFANLFWRIWNELEYQLPKETDYCFSFELLSPYNRIVVKQNQNNLVLHGVRNIKTLQEEDPKKWAEKYNFNLVKIFPLQNWQQIIQASEKLDPTESEGYVVCDQLFKRVKVKSPSYVAWSHFRSSFSTRKMLQIIINNEGDEFLAYYPEWRQMYQQITQKYNQLILEIEKNYSQYKAIATQKEFALAVKNLPYSGILFALRSGKSASIREGLANTSLTKIEQLLDLKYTDLGI